MCALRESEVGRGGRAVGRRDMSESVAGVCARNPVSSVA
jgi:hypothetical protein